MKLWKEMGLAYNVMDKKRPAVFLDRDGVLTEEKDT